MKIGLYFIRHSKRMCVLDTKEGKRFSLYKGDELSPIRLVPVELRSSNEIERGEKKKRLEHQLTKGQVIFLTHFFRSNWVTVRPGQKNEF